MTISGDLIEITYNHPAIGAGAFYPKADESFTMNLGGYMTNDEDAGITGAGEMIAKKTRSRWSVEGVIRGDMNTAEDQERLRDLRESPIAAIWTFTHVNGTVYQGEGFPVGSTEQDTGEGTISQKWQGGGRLTKIVG